MEKLFTVMTNDQLVAQLHIIANLAIQLIALPIECVKVMVLGMVR